MTGRWDYQKRAARSVDIALVIRNWLFGYYIVEFEQSDADRTVLYGKQLIKRLSEELRNIGMKGVSSTNLKQCRVFYVSYKEIGQALPDQSFEQSSGLKNSQFHSLESSWAIFSG